MENDIKNCPFCGGKAEYFTSNQKINGDSPDKCVSRRDIIYTEYAIRCRCEVCGAMGKEFWSHADSKCSQANWDNMACRDAIKDAIKAWNMRYQEIKLKQQSNPDISDVALKMAIAYVQTQYATELKNIEPFEVDEKDLFYGMVLNAYKYYNSLSIKENLLEMEEYDDE